MHNTFFEAPRGGHYRFSFSANSNDERSPLWFQGPWWSTIEIYKNGNKMYGFRDRSTDSSNNMSYTWMMYLERLDKIDLRVPKNSWYMKSDMDHRMIWTGQLIENMY